MASHDFITISIGDEIISEFREFLNEQLQDEEFREQWEKIKPEMDLIHASLDACMSQNFDPNELV